MSKERPILFSSEMIRAILAGTKSQTRRRVKHAFADHAIRVLGLCSDGTFDFVFADDTGGLLHCPYGRRGDRLLAQDANTQDTHDAILLEITDVRVERLNDISEEDAAAEGLSKITKDGSLFKYGIPDLDGLPGGCDVGWEWVDWNADPRRAFARLWNSIHGDGAWDANPFVWVISFQKHDASKS